MQRDDLKDLDLEALPWVPVDDWSFARRLPTRTTAVYLLISKKHGVIYIGKASDLRGRWYYYHQCKEDALTLGDCILRWLVVPRADLRAVELALILKYKTPLNQETSRSREGATQLHYDLGRMDVNRFRGMWSKTNPPQPRRILRMWGKKK